MKRVPEIRGAVINAVGCTDGLFALSTRIEDHADSGSIIRVVVGRIGAIRVACIAWEEDSRRRIHKDGAALPGIKCDWIKLRRVAVLAGLRDERIPPES